MKKAQIAIQFNWIFIFIVGAIILAFFLVVIKSQAKQSNLELSAELINNLDTIIKTSQRSSGSFKIIDLPAVTLNFVCKDGFSNYELGNTGLKKDIPYDVIFAPSEMNGAQLISWSVDWKVPYSITSFQFLTNSRIQYIVVNDTSSPFSRDLFNLLPENITKKTVLFNDQIDDYNYDSYKIIFFTKVPQNINTPKSKTELIKIIPSSNGLDGYGTIKFYEESPSSGNLMGNSSYIRKESLLGAIFAQDYTFYECTMKKAYNRLDLINNITHYRTWNLSQETSIDNGCRNIYIHALSLLTYSTVPELYQNSVNMRKDNEDLIRGRNCPLIY
jgi:hypothetical protein